MFGRSKFPKKEAIVKWFSVKKGYGFAVNPDGEDVLIHYSVLPGTGYKTVSQGDKIIYDEGSREDGKYAVKVDRVIRS